MIKIQHVVLPSPEQMEFVIEGMRNPMNSWDKSDSNCIDDCMECSDRKYCEHAMSSCGGRCYRGGNYIGPNDLSLMQKLSAAGTDHRKFMRMMPVMVRITAPLYWWKEFDTYKVGTVANSCSTMHKITEKEFTLEDFSYEHLLKYEDESDKSTGTDISNACFNWDWEGCGVITPIEILYETINMLNKARKLYLKTNDKKYWWQLIQLLPSSYNQTRNVMLNYEVLSNMYHSRKNHKLDEWVGFCKWITTLPYSELITGGNE